MRDRIFLDTNILVYFFADEEPVKRDIAMRSVYRQRCFTGINNINEATNVFTGKYRKSRSDLILPFKRIAQIATIVSFDTQVILEAVRVKERYKYSYFDSLVIALALENNCSRLYTEDLHHGQRIDDTLEIFNIFHDIR